MDVLDHPCRGLQIRIHIGKEVTPNKMNVKIFDREITSQIAVLALFIVPIFKGFCILSFFVSFCKQTNKKVSSKEVV